MIEEPLNNGYNEQAVIETIAKALETFYERLTANLDGIDIYKILKKKNIYLYRAKGVQTAAEVVDSILAAFVSSSEETLFGNLFFEPLAIVVSGGQKAMTEGADITVDAGTAIYTIAVKSGTSVFNADSRKRQEQNFAAAAKRAQQARKAFFPVIGYGYGKKNTNRNGTMELAGRDYWWWLTGDKDFYTKIITYMGTKPEEYAKTFRAAYARALNRMTLDFSLQFCDETGAIDWEKLIAFNSGSSDKQGLSKVGE